MLYVSPTSSLLDSVGRSLEIFTQLSWSRLGLAEIVVELFDGVGALHAVRSSVEQIGISRKIMLPGLKF